MAYTVDENLIIKMEIDISVPKKCPVGPKTIIITRTFTENGMSIVSYL